MAEERIRIEVGFQGGQGLAALVPISVAEELERALANGGDGAHRFEAEDGTYTVALRQLVEVLLDAALGAAEVVDHRPLHDGRAGSHADGEREEDGDQAVDVVADVDHQPNPDRR